MTMSIKGTIDPFTYLWGSKGYRFIILSPYTIRVLSNRYLISFTFNVYYNAGPNLAWDQRGHGPGTSTS